MNLFENSGAKFSDCGKYRYVLWRIWDESKPIILFIGLNPSTANAEKPDATITRIKGFVHSWDAGGFYMMNLFAIISSKPAILKTCADPIGYNDEWFASITPKCGIIIFCWGAFKEARERSKVIIDRYPIAFCLGKNQDGSPKHPLFLLGETELIRF